MMQGTMPGARRRGRPRTAWMDNIKTWTGLPVDESLRMTEDGDKWRKYVHSVAKLGSRTAKEQNRHSVVQFNHRDNIHVVTGGLEKSELENVGPNRRGGKGGTGKRGNIMCMGIEM